MVFVAVSLVHHAEGMPDARREEVHGRPQLDNLHRWSETGFAPAASLPVAPTVNASATRAGLKLAAG